MRFALGFLLGATITLAALLARSHLVIRKLQREAAWRESTLEALDSSCVAMREEALRVRDQAAWCEAVLRSDQADACRTCEAKQHVEASRANFEQTIASLYVKE